MAEAVEGEENAGKRFQAKAQEIWLMKIRPGEASRLSGPATLHCAACGDSLPPPLRKPGSPNDALQPDYSGDRRLVSGLRCRRLTFGSPSVSRAAALLPRRRCVTLLECGFTTAVGCDCSRRTVAKLCVTTKPEAAHQLDCAMPFAAGRAGKHHAASNAPLR